MGDWLHLARRFFGSLRPGGPGPADAAWAESHLTEHEVGLWRRMSGPDRRHAVGVARKVESTLTDRAERPVIAAALLHDVGKIESGLRTYGRVVATLAGKAVGHETAGDWQQGRGFTRRVGIYLRHDAIGADLLSVGGSDPLTVTWAREHHLTEDRWTLDRDIARALKAADDD